MPPPAPAATFTLDAASGVFTAPDGRRVVPVGVNYWPGSCGVELWRAWPAVEIRHDLDIVQGLGLNCVRFFLRWQDFEPAAGVYDEAAFDRLRELLRWHRERRLLAHPSLFVGYMSGGVFWPEWRRGRNVFGDPVLRERAAAFAAKAAAVCAEFPDTVLALDLGNELCCLEDSATASPAEVADWCGAVAAAAKRSFPGVLVVAGNEQNQVIADRGWRFDAQPGCDFLSMHTYPVSTWHSIAFDGMGDPLGRSLLPFYVKCARAFGPVLVQEFGTLLTRGEPECDGYLRAVLPAARAAGANGFLWWCLRDISAAGHPYDKCAFEGQLGLVDTSDRVKPGLRYFLEFAAAVQSAPPPSAGAPEVMLYWPQEYYPRDNPANPGNDPWALSRQLAMAHFLLQEAGRSVGIVRGDRPLPAGGTIVIAGAKLTRRETEALRDWVQAGGRLLFHGLDAMTWGAAMERLVGAAAVDFGDARPRRFDAFGAAWEARCYARDIFLRLAPETAEALARDAQGNPLLLRNRLGRGCVVACPAAIDAQAAADAADPARRACWRDWYRAALEALAAD